MQMQTISPRRSYINANKLKTSQAKISLLLEVSQFVILPQVTSSQKQTVDAAERRKSKVYHVLVLINYWGETFWPCGFSIL